MMEARRVAEPIEEGEETSTERPLEVGTTGAALLREQVSHESVTL